MRDPAELQLRAQYHVQSASENGNGQDSKFAGTSVGIGRSRRRPPPEKNEEKKPLRRALGGPTKPPEPLVRPQLIVETVVEPPEPGAWEQIEAYLDKIDVLSDKFNMVVGVVIALNSVIIGLETDQGRERYIVFEHLLCMFYVFEMYLRIRQLQWKWPFDAWNIFDALLVTVGIVDLYVLPYLNSVGGMARFVSLLRLLRMTRVLRIIRLFRMFAVMNAILKNFVRALTVVMWVSILILIFDYILAIVVTQTIGHHAYLWGDKEQQIQHWFGSIARSMQTLFTVMTLAEWQVIALALEEKIPRLVVLPAMLLYIFISTYTMLSLITGMITESLLRHQLEKNEAAAVAMEESKKEFFKNLENLFNASDGDKDGKLKRSEFKHILNTHHELVEGLQALEINLSQDELTKIGASISQVHSDRTIPVSTFMEALTQTGGEAKASNVFDLKSIVSDFKSESAERGLRMRSDVDEIRTNMNWLRQMVKSEISDAHTEVLDIKGSLAGIHKKVDDMLGVSFMTRTAKESRFLHHNQ
eukprot:gnl/TRDRNA2_/TRDRNA2_35667_c0_seq1.p1 gnl/TRDRNA2_/TRDRNA2_35667_c0~~gnl/TRDRNA2_/TRDRNA2_35667_c0_seq1.p1  ORF type:complete len:536 (+),score=116.12 gnl/TRDRNA2_/TRDRNA2_35667_c0_seq1:24-1610(+)